MDLIEEYFKRDLAESEEDQLEAELAFSPEEALRWTALAEAKYQSFGLPEPVFPGGGDLPDALRTGGRNRWSGLAILLILAAGILWFFLSPLSCFPSADALDDPAQAQLAGEGSAPKKIAALEKTKSMVRKDPPPPSTPQGRKAKSTPGMVKPLAVPEGASYEALSVTLKQKKSGVVTVRVLDSKDREVRLLYAGVLKPGAWNFLWEGHLQDGSVAPPGDYQVEVRANGKVQRKKVDVR